MDPLVDGLMVGDDHHLLQTYRIERIFMFNTLMAKHTMDSDSIVDHRPSTER